jgi:hypothetical protein
VIVEGRTHQKEASTLEASSQQMLCPNPKCATQIYIATVTLERMAGERAHEYVSPCPECWTEGVVPLTR